MPLYDVHFGDEKHRDPVELSDDAAAWGQLVSFVGTMLRDVDRQLPGQAHIEVGVYEGERCVGSLEVLAHKGGQRRLG